jgi:hypothetical protein
MLDQLFSELYFSFTEIYFFRFVIDYYRCDFGTDDAETLDIPRWNVQYVLKIN